MINELNNPFSVTKATEFSDSQILEYWVNFNSPKNDSRTAILTPTELLPKYIIGSKGCGKTHILRYFSYQVQKIRFNSNISNLLLEDRYVGFYSIIGGANSSRFAGKNINESEWKSAFEYYFELFICDNLLHTINEIMQSLHISVSTEKKVVRDILSFFSNFKEIQNIFTIEELIDFLNELRRNIDSEIQNAAFTRKLNVDLVRILFNQGDLIFGIPNAIASHIKEFENVNFVFIFDEYEKLFPWQMEFINTLVWDKRGLVTFWVGLRRYGYITRNTQSGQEMKAGSEFEPIDLDEIIRNHTTLYKRFAEQLYTSRLIKHAPYSSQAIGISEVKQNFKKKFESYNEEIIINQITKKNMGKEYPHISEFRDKLLTALKKRKALNMSNEKEVEIAVKAIEKGTKNRLLEPLEQKYKLLLFYKRWNKASNNQTYQKLLTEIDKEYKKYLNNQSEIFSNIKNKWKQDLIAQLTKENEIKNTEYAGLDEFIDLSQGNPRSFIIILKKVIEYSTITGENPLNPDGKISLSSQYFAVYDTAKWFFEDAEISGEDGKKVYNSLRNLANYLMLYRFCDNPPETSVSTFYLNVENMSNNAVNCLEKMITHAFLIESKKGRKAKSTGVSEREFQLNKMLAPLWNLPTVKRGIIYLKPDIIEAIFNFEQNNKFDSLYKKKRNELNAPNFLFEKDSSAQYELFE